MSTPDRLDVDARFLLANERTLLAWLRTALALLAAAAAVYQFADDVAEQEVLAFVLAALGTFAAGAGGWRYAHADRALRRGVLPSTGLAGYLLAGAVGLLGLALAVALLVTAVAG